MTNLDPWLRDILRCPACRAELVDEAPADPAADPLLRCTDCGLGYRIDAGIPVLLVDEAVPPTEHRAADASPEAAAEVAAQPDIGGEHTHPSVSGDA